MFAHVTTYKKENVIISCIGWPERWPSGKMPCVSFYYYVNVILFNCLAN